jgi:hypothetical protein
VNEPDEQKKARIVAERVARTEKLNKVVERQKKNLAKNKNVQGKISKHDVKPKLNGNDKEKLQRHFLKQLRYEEAVQVSPEHQGMAIGLMLGAEKNPDLRGLVAGLAGLKDENETEEK